MKFTFLPMGICVLALAACGGSNSTGDQVDQMQPPGGPAPIFSVSTPSATELSGMYSFNRSIAPAFDAGNYSTLITPAGSIANFEGGMQVGVGSSEEYLSGDLNMQFNLINQSGNGTVTNMTISGNDVENRLISVFDVLDVTIPNVSGATFSGTISGVYRDQAQDPNNGSVDYIVDTDLDGRFVAGSLSDEAIGVVSGTLSDPDRGAVPVFGVIAADRSLFD